MRSPIPAPSQPRPSPGSGKAICPSSAPVWRGSAGAGGAWWAARGSERVTGLCGLEQCSLALGVELTAFLGLTKYSWGQTEEGRACETQPAHRETEAPCGNAPEGSWASLDSEPPRPQGHGDPSCVLEVPLPTGGVILELMMGCGCGMPGWAGWTEEGQDKGRREGLRWGTQGQAASWGSEGHAASEGGAGGPLCQIPGHGDGSASPSERPGPCSGGYTKAWETRSMELPPWGARG